MNLITGGLGGPLLVTGGLGISVPTTLSAYLVMDPLSTVTIEAGAPSGGTMTLLITSAAGCFAAGLVAAGGALARVTSVASYIRLDPLSTVTVPIPVSSPAPTPTPTTTPYTSAAGCFAAGLVAAGGST